MHRVPTAAWNSPVGEPLTIGILGANSWIANAAVIPAINECPNAILGTSGERSGPIGYPDVLSDPDVDAVYIALANGDHLEWVERAAEAGKHVLCEKPLGLNATETEAMFASAAASDRLLVEAVWGRWHPRFARIVELATSGAIGDIEHIETAFTFTSEMTDNYRLSPSMGGGALLDVGCYQAHAWVALTKGAADFSITELARTVGPTGIDLTTDVNVRINNNVTAHAVSSFALPSNQQFIVRGTQGQISTVSGESFTTWNEVSSLLVNDVLEEFPITNAFVEMVENVSRLIDGEDGWIVSSTDSIRVAQILDTIAATTL